MPYASDVDAGTIGTLAGYFASKQGGECLFISNVTYTVVKL